MEKSNRKFFKNNIDSFIFLLIQIIFLTSTILTLKNYGLSWDEGLGNLFFGQRYFNYFLSFQEKYVDFKADLFQNNMEFNLYASPFRNIPYEFPPLADTISAGFMHILSDKLQLMNPVDGFHIAKIVIAGIFLIFFYKFIIREVNSTTALISTFMLAFYPRFWSDVHFNPKDIPLMIFFSLTIFAYVSWKKNKSWKTALVVGIVAGATIAIKANAVFLPIILVLGLWDINISINFSREQLYIWGKGILHHLFMIITALIFYIASWPYLFVQNNPISGIKKYFEFIIDQGGRRGPLKFQFDPLIQVITTMPEVMLFFFLIGIFFSIKIIFKNPNSIYRLFLVWLIVPILRISLPGMVNFDGIRHFLEFLPAACILSGIGLWQTSILINKIKPKYQRISFIFFCCLLISNFSIALISMNPHQYIYYNQLIGGVSGARQKFGENEVTDYWGISYRKGMEWLNEKANENSKVVVPVAGWLVELTAPIWFDNDIGYLAVDTIKELDDREETIYIMVLERPGYFNSVAEFAVENYQEIYVESVNDVRLMTIYKKDN